MLKKLLTGASPIAIAVALSSGPALAGGLVSHQAPPPAPSWTAPYIGVYVGAVIPEFDNNWKSGRRSNDFDAPPVNDLEEPGSMLGVRIGYDYQMDWAVIGVEADASEVWLQNATYYVNPSDSERTNSERAELTVDSLASIRGKLGLSLFDDSTLVYATGGVGYVSTDFTASTSDTDPRSGDETLSKWVPVVGGGAELLVLPNVSIGANALYYFVDESRSQLNIGDGSTTDSSINFDGLTTIDVSLKYRFNGAVH